MKTGRFLLSGLFLLTAVLCGQDAWWNKAWQFRLPLSLNSGMNPVAGQLASVKIPLENGKIALSSGRLIAENGQEIPCLLKQDGCGDYFVGWRPEKLKMLEKRNYMLYFSEQDKQPGMTLQDAPEYFSGMNLIPSADFKSLDQDGHPLDWAMHSRGYGMKDKWNEKNRSQMKVVMLDGKPVLELTANAVVYVKVKAGHQYRFSCRSKYDADRFGITVWYRGKTIHEYLIRELGVSNYKMQVGGGPRGKWNHLQASTFLFLDNKTKECSMGNKKLLKYTELAFISLNVQGGKAWISDICYEDITDSGSMVVKTGTIERK